MRGFIVFLTMFSGIFAFQANSQCRISFTERARDIPTYVENGWACLDHVPEGYRFDEMLEARFAERINNTRKEHGLDTLTFRKELRKPARWHSLDMAANDFFNHQGLDKLMPKDRINALDRTLLRQGIYQIICLEEPFLRGEARDHLQEMKDRYRSADSTMQLLMGFPMELAGEE